MYHKNTRQSFSVKSGSCPSSAAAVTDKYSGSSCATSFTRAMISASPAKLVFLRGCKVGKDEFW